MGAVSPRVRFGIFEVDLQSGELFRHGFKVKLQNQLFRLLAVLVDQPGQVVTREELRKKLWPEDTFVDFEQGLNKAINGLRGVLKDHAKKPRFIETLPRRGYRFIPSVQVAAVNSGNRAPDLARVLLQQARGINSLAVLPLENHSGDPAQEYFCDGMTEELISAVSRISSLRVISRTSVMRYKGARKSLPAIAKELRVDAVVEGSVTRSDQKVRITAQLIHALDDRHLWSGRYERELHEILQLQAEIAESIGNQIHKLLDPEPGHLAGGARQVHPQAYEACLKGTFFRDKMTPADLEKSTEFFLQAISLDPAYARAYAELSQSYFYLGLFGVAPCTEVFPKAKASAAKALELDETIAAAHNALAAIHILYDWDWAAAEAACRRAVELRPGDSMTRVHLADYMSIRGQHDDAIAEYKVVLELDPISRVCLGHFGLILYRARLYDESIAQCVNALEIDPTYANALWFLALALEQKGRRTESIVNLEKAVSLSRGPHYRALLGRAYALAGDNAKALNILDELKALSQQRCVSPFDIAVVYFGLGDLTAAFHWLEEAYQQRVFRIIELTLPMFDSLRSDRRWHDLVGRIGLAQ